MDGLKTAVPKHKYIFIYKYALGLGVYQHA